MTAALLPTSPPRGVNDVGVHCFLGLRRFAVETGVPYDLLQRWRIRGPYYVPPPVVLVGRWPGWPLPMIETWTPTIVAGSGPVPMEWRWPHPTIEAADTVTMCRHHDCAHAGLWLRVSRGEIARPDIWVDDKPGWIPWARG
ncbi:hypothetical protein D7D52_07105 [Nocardia yunnanensis]|uniref:Uncharacterized protein n=1 Tax=Nocardia yunnanensis TaxID=2382165 RepID=A0A386Z928_9NOCA|nr:hypothetical protein [Nocardia yunnanensis]AYF73663.1 hypothetical protein D7D52_07105 [Nocardia yunnanensis]